MTRLPSPYPHQVVANWIAANDDHAHAPVLSFVEKTSSPIEKSSIAAEPTHLESTPQNITQDDGLSPFDYDVAYASRPKDAGRGHRRRSPGPSANVSVVSSRTYHRFSS